MTRFTLAILPDGKAILATQERLDKRAMEELVALWNQWREGLTSIAIIPDCDVVQVAEVDLDLEARTIMVPMPPPSHANAISGPQTIPPRGVGG